MGAYPGISNQDVLLGPSVCCNPQDEQWSIDDVIQAGFIDRFAQELKILSVQKYPNGSVYYRPLRRPVHSG